MSDILVILGFLIQQASRYDLKVRVLDLCFKIFQQCWEIDCITLDKIPFEQLPGESSIIAQMEVLHFVGLKIPTSRAVVIIQ